MEESKQLTAGQQVVVDAYLTDSHPAETFDDSTCRLVDTQTMMLEMASMCNIDENALCDYLASKGYRAHYGKDDGISGWILKESMVGRSENQK